LKNGTSELFWVAFLNFDFFQPFFSKKSFIHFQHQVLKVHPFPFPSAPKRLQTFASWQISLQFSVANKGMDDDDDDGDDFPF